MRTADPSADGRRSAAVFATVDCHQRGHIVSPLPGRYLVFNDFCQTNYIIICQTDLRQIFRVGSRTMAVDDQLEFSDPLSDVGG